MSDAGSVDEYNDRNRAFLQAFMARGTMTLKEGQEVLAAIYTVAQGREVRAENITKHNFESFIVEANEAISPLDYEIKSIQHQTHRDRIWAFVNSVSDPLTQMATTRTSEEIFYIRRFLDAMFETYNTKRREVMAVTGMQAVETKIRKPARQSEGEAGTQVADKGLTVDQAERLLAKLVQEKWIEKSREGFYRLSPRALIELRTWLIETYNDPDEPDEWQRIKSCIACKELITVGQRCANLDCNVRLHNVCEEAYWRANPSKKCSKCRTAWDGKHYVGQKAVTTRDDYLKEKRKNGGNKRSREVVEEEEVEEEDEAPESEPRRRKSRAPIADSNGGPSRRKSRPAATLLSQETSEEDEEGAAQEDEGSEAEDDDDE